MDPEDLPRLLAPLAHDQADYTKGNRLFTGEAWEIIPRYRYIGNAVLSLLTKVASGYWHVADSQSGYTAITAAALRVLHLDRLYRRYGFPNHLLVELNNYDFRVRDVPIRPVYGVGEVSGIRLQKVIPTLSWLLLKCYFWRMKEKYVIRDFHPLIFFLGLGLFLSALGLGLGAWIIYLRLHTGQAWHCIPLAMWMSVCGVGVTPCLWFSPPPAPAWQRKHISLVDFWTPWAAFRTSTPGAGTNLSLSPTLATVLR